MRKRLITCGTNRRRRNVECDGARDRAAAQSQCSALPEGSGGTPLTLHEYEPPRRSATGPARCRSGAENGHLYLSNPTSNRPPRWRRRNRNPERPSCSPRRNNRQDSSTELTESFDKQNRRPFECSYVKALPSGDSLKRRRGRGPNAQLTARRQSRASHVRARGSLRGGPRAPTTNAGLGLCRD